MRDLDDKPVTDERVAGSAPVRADAPPAISEDEMVRAASSIDGLIHPVARAIGRELDWRYVAVGLLLVAYAALFPPLHAAAGTAAAILSTVPVVVVATVSGTRLGLIAAVLAMLANMAYLHLLGGIGFALLSQVSGIMGSVALLNRGGGGRAGAQCHGASE